MTSAEYAAIDAKLIISDVEDLSGAISIGRPKPISSGPITFALLIDCLLYTSPSPRDEL